MFQSVWLPGLLLVSFHLVSGSIDEVIRNAGQRSTGRMAGRSTADDTISDGMDMMLSPKQYARLYKGVRGRNDGDNVGTPWTDGIIPYEIRNEFNAEQLAWIQEAMHNWEAVSCVKFQKIRPRENPTNRIIIHKGNGGCSATLGMEGGARYVNLDPGCFWRGTIEHELGHVLGLVHEHQRFNRDQYLRVNYYAADPKNVAQLTKYAEGSDHKFGLEYDYESVMHYGKMAFNDWSTKMQTFYPRDRTKTDVIGQALKASYIDAKLINLVYKCSERCRRPQQCRKDCFLTADCRCLCKRDFKERCQDRLPDCRERAQRGECRTDQMPMQTKCRKSCGLCSDNPSTVPQLLCVDGHPQCREWARTGECEKNRAGMLNPCSLSCGVCDERLDVPPGPCRDINSTCRHLASEGQCDMHPETMLTDCKKSCDFCPEDVNNRPSRPGRCEDSDSVCEYWKNTGKCFTHRHAISKKCPGACGTCNERISIPSGCKDTHELCLGWAFNGECEANPGFMKTGCALSCQTCPGLPKPDFSSLREDLHYKCQEWGEAECRNNFAFMKNFCRKTCARVIQEFGDCYDSKAKCSSWAAMGECDNNPTWMRQNCQKSCGTCKSGGGGGGRPNTPSTGSNCEDNNDTCPAWARGGQCEKNPGYMHVNCRKSCRKC